MIELSGQVNLQTCCRVAAAGMRQAARLFNDTFRYRLGALRRIPQAALCAEPTDRLSFSGATIELANRFPDSLRECLEYWRDHCPWHETFGIVRKVLGGELSYILYGMEFRTERLPGS